MTSRKITVVARIKAKPDMVNAVRKELLSLVPPTVQEPGCITYDLHQSADDKTLFMFYENWCSRDDLDAHMNKPHLQAALGKVEGLLAEPVDISLWHMLD